MEAILEKKTDSYEMLSDVLEGLKESKKTLPSKYFYDQRGSELFERITELDEYYLTRTELNIMKNNINDIAKNLGTNIQLVELGSGSSFKTRLLLNHLDNIYSYVPVDISKSFLDQVTKDLQAEYPKLNIQPVATDYTRSLSLPVIPDGVNRVIYFPGSTIGNFTKEKAQRFLALIADSLDEHGGLLIGFDLDKDRQTLLDAYNDSEGITATFNKNILRRINRELGADFDLIQFDHIAIFNENKSRIEMHLVSNSDQVVNIGSEKISFKKGETIHTENSHKYTFFSFREMTAAYFKEGITWTDPKDYFAVQYLHKL